MKQVIQIFDSGNGKYQAFTKLHPEQTANILISLALNFIRQDEREITLKQCQSNIINPNNGTKFKINPDLKN